MKKLFTLLCILALSLTTVSVQATVLLTEHFNQATENLATNDNASSIGADWTNIAGSGNIYMNDADLTYTGYKSSSDDTKSIEYKATYGKKVAKSFTSKNSGSIYAAAIVKVSSCGASSAGNSRNYLWTFCDVTTTNVGTAGYHYGRLCVQKTDTKFQFGISKQSEAAAFLAYTDELEYNTPYLVVLEYKFVSGNQNDIVYLYVNPTKGDKPEATIECHQSYINPNTSADVGSGTKPDPSNLTSFVFSNTSSGTSGSKWNCLIDELKVVTDWADLWEAGEDPDPTPSVDAPEPEKSDVTTGSATISWDAVEDADSYTLQWKVNGGSYSDDIDIDKEVRSYSMTDLESETKYYVRVKTIIGEDESDWAEINFTTSSEPSTIDYQDITFNKYSTQDAMPTSGTYYLAKNVVEYDNVTLTDNLTLNLHGKQLYMYGTHIVVPSGVIFTIYDDAGDGEISGGYAGSFVARGIITVETGGTLIIGEGNVINQDDANEQVAIHNNGTLKLSGAPVISGNKTDIYLGATITIESGKPLTNATPYKVYKATGSSFTSGWANMSGESPKDYFSSTNVGNSGICLNASGEAQIVPALSLSESSTNTSIASNSGQLVNASFTRSLTSSQYNTFCLPFALANAQLQAAFGTSYDLEEFVEASLDGDQLSLTFNKVTSLTAGKPYLLQPSVDVVNPSFEGVTIGVTAPADQTSDTYISFHGTFAPTELTGGNQNILFLGADNELFWPETSENLNGFRAYFEVKASAAKIAKRARIINKEEAPTSLEKVQSDNVQGTKYIENGQLFILYNGAKYNVQGQVIK